MGPDTTSNQSRRSGFRWDSAGATDQTASLNPPWQQPQTQRGPQAVLDLAVDAVKLADLQVQLLTVDVREFWTKSWTSLLILAAGAATLVAALPVAMFGCAEYLRQSMSLSIEFALLLVSGGALLIASGLVAWSASRLAVAAKPLQRSAEELRENLRWMRGLLHEEDASAKF